MNRIVRAAGIAAAALALAAGASFADPSMAQGGDSAPMAGYLAHAAATIDGAGEASTAPGDPADYAAVAAGAIRIVEAAMPRPRALEELIPAYTDTEITDPEEECLARAVYFEARSEPVDGQLAVAEVVLNRAASGRYPEGICDVVTQRKQFSFIVDGRFPMPDKDSKAWRKAVAIARIANDKLAGNLSDDVLWYHADYVAPVWRHGLERETKIGLHIFYN